MVKYNSQGKVNGIYIIINIILVSTLLFYSFKIFTKINDYLKADEVYRKIKVIKENIERESNIVDLSNINKDYRGWITIKNTNIDYPIVQSKDNNLYLTRDINKNYLAAGSIFLDYRNNNFSDKNTVIYGHHMRNDTMFGQLENYKNKDFFYNNNIISISKPNGKILNYEVFSAYITNSNDNYIKTDFKDDLEFIDFINDIVNKSIYKHNLNINFNDKILTLSTCSYEFKDARMVVHAKLINKI